MNVTTKQLTKQASEYLERAERARKARKAAPAVSVTGFVTIPQKDIIARLAEGEGGVDKVMHRIFVPQREMGGYADKGYAPVMRDGELVTFESDALVEIPVEFYHQSQQEVIARSNAMLGERIAADRETESARKVGAGEDVTIKGVAAKDLEAAATAVA